MGKNGTNLGQSNNENRGILRITERVSHRKPLDMWKSARSNWSHLFDLAAVYLRHLGRDLFQIILILGW